MSVRSHYLNDLDIKPKPATPLPDMERRDFIDTINDLRSTIESLRMTAATLLKTIESVQDGEKLHREEALKYEERIAELIRQCECQETQNRRHGKNESGGKTQSQCQL